METVEPASLLAKTGKSIAADRQRLAAFARLARQNRSETAIGTGFAELSRRN
jgi:hypothetical protein